MAPGRGVDYQPEDLAVRYGLEVLGRWRRGASSNSNLSGAPVPARTCGDEVRADGAASKGGFQHRGRWFKLNGLHSFSPSGSRATGSF